MEKQLIQNNVKVFRKKAGLRQIDVAYALGFTTITRICRWEKGLAYPSVVNLLKMAKLFQVPAEEIYPL